MTPATVSTILLWVVVIVLALAVAGLLAQVRALAQRVYMVGPRGGSLVGTSAHNVILQSGEVVAPPFVVIFVRRDCSVRHDLLDRLAQGWSDQPPVITTLVLSNEGGLASHPSKTAFPDAVQLSEDPQVAAVFGVPAFPWVLTVDETNRIVRWESGGAPNRVPRLLADTRGLFESQRTGAKASHNWR